MTDFVSNFIMPPLNISRVYRKNEGGERQTSIIERAEMVEAREHLS